MSLRRAAIRALALVLLAIAVVAAVVVYLPGSVGLRDWMRHRTMTESPSAERPSFDRTPLLADLAASGLSLGDPVHVRIFKREARLEIWMQPGSNGPFRLFRSFAICTYSGGLGPKLREGDRQAPEGFYKVRLPQLNPNSRHHLAFNLGFPNEFDRQLGRTGSFLMVHGGCTSVGCYAMTDAGVDTIYALVEAGLRAGQDGVDVAIFPFALTDAALLAEATSPWLGFWRNLKQGQDLFERDRRPPRVGACNGEYRFGPAAEGCVPISGWV